ncbi:MAG: ribbon-helix-helix protein, CopG family [Burkholderiales bacterium]|nr:ribbon-helix-helix protein, CopG family [Burkholderiales bacterium]
MNKKKLMQKKMRKRPYSKRLSAFQVRRKTISVRVTDEMYASIILLARARDMSISEYMARLAFDHLCQINGKQY